MKYIFALFLLAIACAGCGSYNLVANCRYAAASLSISGEQKANFIIECVKAVLQKSEVCNCACDTEKTREQAAVQP